MNRYIRQLGLGLVSCLLALSVPLYAIMWIYPHFTDIISFEKEVDAGQIANHVAKMLVLDSASKTLSRESINESFVKVLEEARADFDLTKVKIFSSRGEVIYSSDPQEVGTLNTHQYFSDLVAQGKIFTQVVRHDEQTMEGETVQKDVVETYVPLLRGQDFIGAFEVYYDITYTEHIVSKFVARSRGILLILSLFLLLSILFISFSAITFLKKLRAAEQEMQRLRERIPPLYGLSPDKME